MADHVHELRPRVGDTEKIIAPMPIEAQVKMRFVITRLLRIGEGLLYVVGFRTAHVHLLAIGEFDLAGTHALGAILRG